MRWTKMKLKPRDIDGRTRRSNDARGYQHALYLDRCDARLRQPISQNIGWTFFCFYVPRREHPGYQGRPFWQSATRRHLGARVSSDGTHFTYGIGPAQPLK